MKKDLIILGFGTLLFISLPMLVFASEIVIDDYRGGLSPKWVDKSFKGKTIYRVTREENQLCIKATSRSSASGLYYKIDYDPREYPILSWRWKIDHIISKGNALKKERDDYAARVYVVFPSLMFWKTKAVNYIWANRLSRGKMVPNPYTSNALMIAVESGSKHAGQWMEEKRNILEDYCKYFGQEPPRVGVIAIMTDTDNTGERATAWYGPIRILKGPVKGCP